MKKYLAITAALALVLTACGHAAPDSTPTLTAATETTQATAAPAEQPQTSTPDRCRQPTICKTVCGAWATS